MKWNTEMIKWNNEMKRENKIFIFEYKRTSYLCEHRPWTSRVANI